MRPELTHTHQIIKDIAAQQEIEERLNSKKVYKNHQRAKLNGTTSQKEMNSVIEEIYRVILKKVKELYCKLPNEEDRIIIQLNNKLDPTDSHGLFTLMTPTFFFYLECDIVNNYRIEYLFYQCPFETEIEQLIKQYLVHSHSTEIVKQPDYPTFFRNCLSVQPDRFVHVL